MSGSIANRWLADGSKAVRSGYLFLFFGALLCLLMIQGCAAKAVHPVAAQDAPSSRTALIKDTDRDGVADNCDECAGTPESAAVDAYGCPLSLYLHLRITDTGQDFQQNSALLGRLRKLSAILRANPKAKLFIEAHTDTSNTRTVQKNISQQRAETLAALLAGQLGVRRDQIKAIGYGGSRPLVSNTTPEGRKRNTRLELVIKGFYQRGGQFAAPQPASETVSGAPYPAAASKFPEPLTLGFKSGSAAASGPDSQALSRIVRFLRLHPETALRIEGHTDSIGSTRSNQALSEKRARQIYNTLVATYGIADERLNVRGYGEERPIADNATAQGRRKNRRVRLVLYSPRSTPPASIAYAPLAVPAASGSSVKAKPSAAGTSPKRNSRIPKTKLSADRTYEIKVSVNKRRLWLYEVGAKGKKELVRTYVVATPRPGKPVPWGSGEITRIEFNPWWYPTPNIKRDYFKRKGIRLPDSVPPGRRSNPMGKFKIHLSHGSGFRIHGTNRPSQIGRRVSSGCIRMHNADGLEMAHALAVGTRVTVVR